MSRIERLGMLFPSPDPLSASSWSGTPAGLASGFRDHGLEVVPIGVRLPRGLHEGVAVASRITGKRGAVADRTLVRQASRTWALRRALAAAGPLDAVVAMNTETYDLAALRRDVGPVVTYDDCTLHQMWAHPHSDIRQEGFPDAEVRVWLSRQAASCRAADACFVSTAWAGASMVGDYGVSAERVHSVGIGHRPRRPVPEGRPHSPPRFLFVGVDWRRKNGELLLEAFAQVRRLRPDATLHLVGGHPRIDQAGVVGHGLLRRDDPEAQRRLDSLFGSASVFVLPSRFEPAGIAYLEAASAGLPIVATTEGGAASLLGDAALAVDPDDLEALVSAMVTLCDSRSARARGLLAARRAAELTWRAVAGRVITALESGNQTQDHPQGSFGHVTGGAGMSEGTGRTVSG